MSPVHNTLFLPVFLETKKNRQTRQLPNTKILWHLSIKESSFVKAMPRQSLLFFPLWLTNFAFINLLFLALFFFLLIVKVNLHLPLSFYYIFPFFWLFFRFVVDLYQASGSHTERLRKLPSSNKQTDRNKWEIFIFFWCPTPLTRQLLRTGILSKKVGRILFIATRKKKYFLTEVGYAHWDNAWY